LDKFFVEEGHLQKGTDNSKRRKVEVAEKLRQTQEGKSTTRMTPWETDRINDTMGLAE